MLAATPILLFLLNLLLEIISSSISREVIALMRYDSRPRVREIGENEFILGAIGTYVTYGTHVKRIFQATIIALLSLMISQYTCPRLIRVITPVHLLLLAFLIFVLIKLCRRQIDPAAVGSTNRYYYGALSFSFLVFLIGWVLNRFPQFCSTP